MTTAWIEVPGTTDAPAMGAYLALPPSGRGPGIVLCQEIFGVTASLRAVADDLAQEGYVVLVPDLFWRLQPRVELRYSKEDVARAMALSQRLDQQLLLEDMRDTVQALEQHPAVVGRIAAYGFCLGGRVAMLAAAAGLVSCAVAYYPVALEQHLERLATIKVPVVIHFGAEDPLTPPVAVSTVVAALARSKEASVHVYPGVKHGFAAKGRPAYCAPSAGMAYSRSLAVLRAVLGPWYDLNALWEAHRACEFVSRDAAATMATMVPQPYVNHVPTMTGGYGQTDLHRFYSDHFIPRNPADMRTIPISRTIGVDRVVNEGILCFTHDTEIPWMLPGIAPTGCYVEVALVGIITFRGDKLYHEHIYWDQASVLVQIGLLDPAALPVVGREQARKVLDPSLPSNELMPQWTRGA